MKGHHIAASVLSIIGAVVNADAIYTKNSPVLQVTAKDFSSLIEQSNHTSIVEFYAPWCGHCQNLKPAYEKAAKSLAGLAKVAAVDCDEETNKPLCGRMGVQGFPTLKIVKPGTKKGKPVIEDYQGARSAKAIVDAVVNKIPNHVKKIQDAELDAWLEDGQAKAILFTEKGTTAALIKALAVDFLGSIEFATIREKEKDAVKRYAVTTFPTVVLEPGNGKPPATYKGDMNKESLVQFFSQVAPPNPDPAPKKGKSSSSKKSKDASGSTTASAKFSKASEAQRSSEFDDYMQAHTIELNDDTPIESPLPIVEHDEKPMVMKEAAAPLPQLNAASELETACLAPKSGNCILILLPTSDNPDAVEPLAAEALASFAEVAEKHHKRETKIFPFYGVPAENEAGKSLRQELSLKSAAELEIIAINMKRKWYRQYAATRYDVLDAENFVDAIRLGEGTKKKIPADFKPGKNAAKEKPAAPKVGAEPILQDHEDVVSTTATPEPAATADVPIHNEL